MNRMNLAGVPAFIAVVIVTSFAWAGPESGLVPRVISIPVEIGNQTRTFNVDTGATMSIVAADDQSLKFQVVGEASLRAAGGAGQNCKLTVTPKATVLNASFEYLRVFRCDHVRSNNLGMEAFEGQILGFIFSESHIQYLKEQPRDFEYFEMFQNGDNRRFLPLTLDGVPTLGMFDTGAAFTTVDSQYVATHADQFEFVSEDFATDFHGNRLKTSLYKVKHLKIGKVGFNSAYVHSYDFGQMRDDFKGAPVIIGNNVILEADWVLNFSTNKWGNRPKNNAKPFWNWLPW